MKDEHLLEDQELAAAFRDVRDTYDGTHPEASVTLQRALFRTRKHASRQRFTRYGLIPIAAVLAASTAWASVTGKLAPVVHSVLETLYVESPRVVAAPPATPVAAPATAAIPLPVEPPVAAPVEAAVPAMVPSPPVPFSEPVVKRTVSVTAPVVADAPRPSPAGESGTAKGVEPVPAPTASAPDPHAPLFAEAHRLHFVERDPARALAAWDRYLAVAPAGRFAPEARYNRALSLVRLGRTDEAKPELEAFARGTYGNYRRDEAKALLEALYQGPPGAAP